MLKGWGTWLGLESAPGPDIVQIEHADITDLKDDKTIDCKEVNIPSSVDRDGEDQPQQLLQKAKGLSGRLLNFASSTSKKLSESVAGTAEKIKKSVEEGKIDGIIDKTIWGDFQKEQNKFVQERNAKKTDAAVPPWVGYNEEETIQQQMLALSADKRNFLRDPPAGVQFQFDFEQMYPIALVMLQEDELLNRMRFDLVPKHVKEDVFWRNYFYRVSLIKQSAQLTALAAQQQAARENSFNPDHDQTTGDLVKPKPPLTINAKPKTNEEEADISTCPGVSEFVSDAFDSSGLKKEDLRREMEQLEFTEDDGTADWERELQRELQDYEVVAGGENPGEQWEKEIEELLQQE